MKINRKQLLIFLCFLISFAAHAYNMFSFPAYFDDEGTYISQAWAILRQGKLAPYTYWYDHAPLGWIIISVWGFLTGGFLTFGPSVNSGRVLMLLIHLLNTYFLYLIFNKLRKNTPASLIAVLLYSLSPLAITLHRMVFLDNISILFVLGALYTLVSQKQRLSAHVVSGFLFGLSILVKESMVAFMPAFFVFILINASRKNIRLALPFWIATTVSVISVYPLFALLKGELFPYGSILGGSKPHVSLIGTLAWQMARKGGYFLNENSEFMFTLNKSWLVTDPLILVTGTAASFLNLIIGIRKKEYLMAGLFFLSYTLYLIRGGIVNDQYLIPLLPFLSLNVGLFIVFLEDIFRKIIGFSPADIKRFLGYFLYLPGGIYILAMVYIYRQNPGIYVLNQTENQIQAVHWIKDNINEEDIVVTDAYALVDLIESGSKDVATVKGPQHYWKIDADPDIRFKLLQDDWKNIDYIVSTPKLRHDLGHNVFPLLKMLEENSYRVTAFENEKHTINSPGSGKILIANGEKVEILKRKSIDDIIVSGLWENYKKNYIHSYGQVVDPLTKKTTSEGQSYAMLRSVWMDDKETFDGVWQWTKDHMQHREKDMLLSWSWGEADGEEKILDSNSAADADSDITLSLIFAYKKWGNPQYLLEATALLRDIWNNEIVEVKGRKLLLSSPDAKSEDGFLINPSYFSPASYRIFARIDTTHEWNKLADDSYVILNAISENNQNTTGLPPNWLLINENGELKSAAAIIRDNPDSYGYDAFRTFWRIALDAQWFNNGQAENYLKNVEPFFKKEWKDEKKFKAVYTLNGNGVSEHSDLATTAGPLSVFTVTDNGTAEEVFKTIYGDYYENINLNEDVQNYYDQNWTWFSVALYKKQLPNLWKSPENFALGI